MNSKKPILLAEDDDIDAESVERALQALKIANRLERTANGEEALAYLKDPAKEKPCVILLDLRMPRMDGIEFLKVIKQEKNLRRILVIILTTSRAERDKLDTLDLGIAGYMVKPVDYKRFVELMKTIDLYWTLSELP